MSDQDNFERQAQVLTDRYQAEIDMKMFLAHWGGYQKIKTQHKKELQELAQEYGVDLNLKDWKLNIYWV